MALQISATNPEHPALLLELPWHLPLEEWPEEVLVPLPRGIARHVVRYAHAGDEVIAVKELAERPALREYELLRDLDRLGIPAVDPLAVVTGRTDSRGASSASVRPVTTASGSTAGMASRSRSRSSSYSRSAGRSASSFTAMTSSPARA